MSTGILRTLLLRDLAALRREVDAYRDDALLWSVPAGAPNSGGALVRHVCGNLRHFVGAVLGGTGYVRDRDAEFGGPPVPRATLLDAIDATVRDVERTLDAIAPGALDADYPQPVAGRTLRTGDFLLHLLAHLAYHLGQVDYHRRIAGGDATSVSAAAVGELPAAAARGAAGTTGTAGSAP